MVPGLVLCAESSWSIDFTVKSVLNPCWFLLRSCCRTALLETLWTKQRLWSNAMKLLRSFSAHRMKRSVSSAGVGQREFEPTRKIFKYIIWSFWFFYLPACCPEGSCWSAEAAAESREERSCPVQTQSPPPKTRQDQRIVCQTQTGAGTLQDAVHLQPRCCSGKQQWLRKHLSIVQYLYSCVWFCQAEEWVSERMLKMTEAGKAELSDLQTKMKLLQKHQVFEAEILAHSEIINSVMQVRWDNMWQEMRLLLTYGPTVEMIKVRPCCVCFCPWKCGSEF